MPASDSARGRRFPYVARDNGEHNRTMPAAEHWKAARLNEFSRSRTGKPHPYSSQEPAAVMRRFSTAGKISSHKNWPEFNAALIRRLARTNEERP